MMPYSVAIPENDPHLKSQPSPLTVVRASECRQRESRRVTLIGARGLVESPREFATQNATSVGRGIAGSESSSPQSVNGRRTK
jgi:hypothetical protein